MEAPPWCFWGMSSSQPLLWCIKPTGLKSLPTRWRIMSLSPPYLLQLKYLAHSRYSVKDWWIKQNSLPTCCFKTRKGFAFFSPFGYIITDLSTFQILLRLFKAAYVSILFLKTSLHLHTLLFDFEENSEWQLRNRFHPDFQAYVEMQDFIYRKQPLLNRLQTGLIYNFGLTIHQ